MSILATNGMIRNNWPVKKLEEVLLFIQNGINPKQGEIGNYPISRIETIQNNSFDQNRVKFADLSNAESKKYKYGIGDIAFSHINSYEKIGKVALYDGKIKDLVHGVNLLRLRTDPKICLSAYLFVLMQAKQFRAKIDPYINKAVNQASINQTSLKNISIIIPPVSIQKKIVEKLDAIRNTQELNDLQIQKTDELFESILEKELNSKTVKNEIKKLSEICDVRDGTHDSPKYQASGIPLITSKNLKDEIDFSNVNYISDKDHEQIIKRSFVENGDILFGMIGTIGNPVIVNTNIKFSIKNVGLIKFPNKLVSNLFIKYFLQSSKLKRTVIKLSRGGTQKFVSLGNLRDLLIPFPDLKEQQRIVKKLEAVQNYKKLLQKQKILLKELFDSVLDKSMKGELDS